MESVRACPGRMLPALGVAVLLCAAALHAQANAPQQDDSSQPAVAAERVMSTLTDGLTGNSARNFLSAFDPDQMPDYTNFADQVRMFFGMYENFRVHYQILEVRADSENSASVTANVELEGDNVNGTAPGVTRNGQVELRLNKSKNGWRIVELRPREFFR